MENYFYLNEKNEQKGPVSPEELISNGVTRNTLVWKNGMAQWLPAGEVPELAKWFTNNLHAFHTPTISSHTAPTIGKQQFQTGQLANLGNPIDRIMLLTVRDCIYHLRHKSGQPLEFRSARGSDKSF